MSHLCRLLVTRNATSLIRGLSNFTAKDVRRSEEIGGRKPTAKIRGGTHHNNAMKAAVAAYAPKLDFAGIDVSYEPGEMSSCGGSHVDCACSLSVAAAPYCPESLHLMALELRRSGLGEVV